jgi:hypothetical protein
MRKDEKGMIVVETISTFILFTFLMAAILALVNIVTLQARIHYAITQATETVSMYSYVLEVTSIAGRLRNLEHNAGEVTESSNSFKNDINALIDGLENFDPDETIYHAGAAADTATSWMHDTAENPKRALSLMVNYGVGEVMHFAFGELMRPLVGRYLSNGSMSGDEYLRSVNVIDGLDGLRFYDFSLFDLSDTSENDSVLLTEGGDVVIVVRYSIDYTFGALPLPFSDFEVTHVVKTHAWLDGNGKGYWNSGYTAGESG